MGLKRHRVPVVSSVWSRMASYDLLRRAQPGSSIGRPLAVVSPPPARPTQSYEFLRELNLPLVRAMTKKKPFFRACRSLRGTPSILMSPGSDRWG